MTYAMTIETGIEEMLAETASSGGSTVSLIGANVPDNGYMVGGITDSLIFHSELLNDGTDRAWTMVYRWVAQNHKLATQEHTYLGGWIDESTGAVYIDLSDWYEDERLATINGIERGELAIWDLENAKEIRL